ncbi:30S ribosomal protein S2 [Gemmatimonas aurantiaca T-27]|uniref:Small ribosomal subunit protein uS2 n=1 Tax=Gemmatimonas aurantiaca (strain DSM 14586 / JCM 11422 / NBRC 100505 / T-27) TaxID=379066 RepID=C1A3Z3_GEMAT|nr:30S ribosomal protein S2 [Gemmatimonas aurantiaca]BAH38818.1 30S ribosomal protein S2 [Gemmatimonas aurantiaca T-27]
MSTPSLEQLLAAGVHFGHQTRRWNPKMRRFIFAERNGIHIIDLQKTLRQIELAQKLVREVVLRGENVLFVCTKRQLAAIVRNEAERCGAMFVTERWLGGMLTNYQTVKKQVKKLKELEAGSEEGGGFTNYTKKEQLLMSRQRDKLSKYLSGIKSMHRLPGLLFIIDSKKERIAVSEANKLGVPIVAIVDTNADPDLITVPIAGNDDAIRSVELIAKVVADTIDEARREAPVRAVEEEQESYTFSSDRGTEPAGRGDRGGRGGDNRGGDNRGGGNSGGGDDRSGGRRPRRRRAKPEAIAARLKPGSDSPAGDDSAPAPSAE